MEAGFLATLDSKGKSILKYIMWGGSGKALRMQRSTGEGLHSSVFELGGGVHL